jgi:hypothetical protein
MAPELVNFINKSVAEVLALPEIRDTWIRDGITPVGNTSEAFTRSMKKELETFEAMYKKQ